MKLCKDCVSIINSKPLPRCESSRFSDIVMGNDKRECLLERLDGIGRCGNLANNFSPKKKEPVVRKNPAQKVKK